MRWVGLSLVLLAVLFALDRSTLPRAQLQWPSDLLQLGLSSVAAGLCALQPPASVPERAPIGPSSASAPWSGRSDRWSGRFERVALDPFTTFSLADLLFLACSTPFVIAALVRPDRPASSSVGLAYDASLLLVLLLHADAYFVLGELVAGNGEEYQAWQTRLLGIRGVVVLLVFLWLIRSSRPALEAPLRKARPLPGRALRRGCRGEHLSGQRGLPPGTHGPGWTVPFLWIGLSALDWKPEAAAPASRSPTVAEPEWRDTRRGTVLALLAVILVPGRAFRERSRRGPESHPPAPCGGGSPSPPP